MNLLKAITVATILSLVSATGAQAFVIWSFEHDSEKDEYHFIVEDDGYLIYLHLDENWDYLDGEVIGPSNPNPEDGTTTPGDESMWKQLLKQQGGTGYLTPSFYDTFIGAMLNNSGYGIGPYYNPADSDNEGGMDPSGGIGFFDPRDFANEIGGAGKLGGIEYDGNGGPARDQIKNAIGKNGSSNDDDDDDSTNPPPGSGFWGEDMPGPPELVNPASRQRSYELR